jgi:hypothetical protein
MKEEEKNINLYPLSPSRVKEKIKIKSRRTPSPSTMNKYNKTIPLAPLNNKN